jgi:hypothetical protein
MALFLTQEAVDRASMFTSGKLVEEREASC